MSIVALGTLALDSIETSKGKVDNIMGGSAYYFASAALFLSQVRLLSVVGDDYPETGFEFFRKNKIDFSGVEIIKGVKTFTWKAKYLKDGIHEISLDTKLNSMSLFKPKLSESYKNPEYLFLGSFDPEIQYEVLKQVRANQAIFLDTKQYWIKKNPKALEQVIQFVDVVIINDEELRLLTNDVNIIRASRSLLRMGPSYVIIKKGENGAFLAGKNGDFFVLPSYPIEEIWDPTGAGDVFSGALISYLNFHASGLQFTDLKRALVYANVVASFVVEDFGAMGIENITIENIETRYRQFLKYFHVCYVDSDIENFISDSLFKKNFLENK